jgi:AcrR family transcriptional regulator
VARKRGLTVEDVAGAAAAIADAEGLDGLTLAAVAARVGVRSPSLYAHVDGLDGLRRLLALRAAAEMGAAFRDATREVEGLEALRALAHAYRRFARARPGLYGAAQRAARPDEDPELYAALAAVVVPVVAALAAAGVAAHQRIHLTRAIRSTLHGFVELEREAGFGMPESVDESFDLVVDLIVSGVRGLAGE